MDSVVNSPTSRANFVSQLKNIMQGSHTTVPLKGFNFDWERPSTAALWGNYTQLARELGDAIHPLGMEVSVCDYGYPDTKWDDTSLFDANVYDQLFIMGYMYTAAQNSSYATLHDNLTGQGAAKAFQDSQIAIGVGTWAAGPSTIWHLAASSRPIRTWPTTPVPTRARLAAKPGRGLSRVANKCERKRSCARPWHAGHVYLDTPLRCY